MAGVWSKFSWQYHSDPNATRRHKRADRWLLWSTLTVPALRSVRLVDCRGREEEIAV